MADIKVTRTQSTSKTGSTRPTKQTSGSDPNAFARHLDRVTGAATAPPVTDLSAVSATSAILAAQELPGDSQQEARRQLKRHGEDILDRLDEIRGDILAGGIPKSRLENLAKMLRARRQSVDDPLLLDIIKDIELRAEVEIAKLSRGR